MSRLFDRIQYSLVWWSFVRCWKAKSMMTCGYRDTVTYLCKVHCNLLLDSPYLLYCCCTPASSCKLDSIRDVVRRENQIQNSSGYQFVVNIDYSITALPCLLSLMVNDYLNVSLDDFKKHNRSYIQSRICFDGFGRSSQPPLTRCRCCSPFHDGFPR